MYRQRKAGQWAVAMRETHGITHGSGVRIAAEDLGLIEVAVAGE
jgi:hypothetical protein